MKKNQYEVDVLLTIKIPVVIEAFTREDAKHRSVELLNDESTDDDIVRIIDAYQFNSPSFESTDSVVLREKDFCEDDYDECEACKNVERCKANGAYHLVCGECVHESDIKEYSNGETN